MKSSDFLCTLILGFDYYVYGIRIFKISSSFLHKSSSYIPTNDGKIDSGYSL
jgi:hypothetical protein